MASFSLHGRYGGKQSKVAHEPSEAEALALVGGCALHWCKWRNSNSSDFFELVTKKVKELEGSSQLWGRQEMVRLFHNRCLTCDVCATDLIGEVLFVVSCHERMETAGTGLDDTRIL